jgi:hypothetical protein
MNQDRAILYTDLSRCQPAGSIADRNGRWRWRAAPYEAAGISGTLLIAGPETEAVPITLPLNVTGWHAVLLGLWSDGWEGDFLLRVKLTGDSSYVWLSREHLPSGREDGFAIDEVFWKEADLTGQDITFAQLYHSLGFKAGIAYVKLVALTAEEVAAVQADRARTDTRRLIAMEDNHGTYYSHRFEDERDLYEIIEPYRHTDVGKLFWCSGGGIDNVSYPTKVGQVYGLNSEDFPRTGDRLIAESMRRLLAKGVDTTAIARDYTRGLGIEFHLSIRMAAAHMHPPYDEVFSSPFYVAHPEWHCRDQDGSPVARLSYAFPQVQDYVLNLIQELADYQPDGINLIFARGGPYLLYEEPLVEDYRQRTGSDPRTLPERDPDYLRYRGEVLTGFMRRVRALCDRASAPGKRMVLSAHVLNDEANNTFYGLDVSTWARDKIVDLLIAYPWRGEPIDQPWFAGVVKGTDCQLFVEILPRQLSPAEYRARALAAYAAGADGLSLWDTLGRAMLLKQWSMARRLGHRDDLAGFDDGEGVLYRTVPLRSVGGYRIDKYPPHWGY